MASKKAGRAAGLAALAGLAYMALSDKNKAKSKVADRDTDTGVEVMPSYAAKKEDAVDTGDFMSRRLNRIDTDDGRAYSTNNLSPMSSPASRAPKAPSASVAAPSAAMPEGAFRGMRSDMKSVGGGRSGGRGGPEAGEEAAYRAKTPAAPVGAYRGTRSDMKDAGAGRGGRGGPEAGEEAAYKARNSDGGKSMIDRQNAALARAENSMVPNTGRKMTVDDYYNSGKAQIDKDAGMFKRGGAVKKMASGGMTSSASKRADGIAQRGKTKGRVC